MLAAPILALGRADPDHPQHGGRPAEPRRQSSICARSSAELGAPVALISARGGEGIEQGPRVPGGRDAQADAQGTAGAAGRAEVPRLGGPGERAGRVSSRRSHQVDAPPGCRFPASRRRAAWFSSLVVVAVFQTIFSVADPSKDAVRLADSDSPAIGSRPCLPDSLLRSLLIDGVWKGVGSVIVFLPQVLLLFLFIGHSGGLGLSGARGADCRPHHGAGRTAGQVVHPAAFGVCLRGARRSCPRAPSKTSATASPPS